MRKNKVKIVIEIIAVLLILIGGFIIIFPKITDLKKMFKK